MQRAQTPAPVPAEYPRVPAAVPQQHSIPASPLRYPNGTASPLPYPSTPMAQQPICLPVSPVSLPWCPFVLGEKGAPGSSGQVRDHLGGGGVSMLPPSPAVGTANPALPRCPAQKERRVPVWG